MDVGGVCLLHVGDIGHKDFREHFCKHFSQKGVDLQSVHWEEWLHGVGLPSFEPGAVVEQTLLKDSRNLAEKWLAGSVSLMHKARCKSVPRRVTTLTSCP
eukprot:5421119-Amphidinium_carterae.4